MELEDNGKGIAAKDLPNIFDRFYRTDASRNSSKGGSGIGLSIVKKIIEEAWRQDMGNQQGRDWNDHVFCLKKISGGADFMSKILIVEDEEAIADLEKDYLELSGFKVEVAMTAGRGLRRRWARSLTCLSWILCFQELMDSRSAGRSGM